MEHTDPSSHYPQIGMRAWYLQEAAQLEQVLGFSTSNFIAVPWELFEDVQVDPSNSLKTFGAIALVDGTPLPKRGVHPELVAHYTEYIRPLLSKIVSLTKGLDGELLISRPSPLDEHIRPDLSFAGVYKSHIPHASEPMRRNIIHSGTAHVLAGRFTQYGNCYYDRHGLNTDRRVGILYMQPFYDIAAAAPLVHGTAYVAGDLIRNEYLISPAPDQPQRNPRLMIRWGDGARLNAADQSLENDLDFANRMTTVLDGLHGHFRAPLDIEYLFDDEGNMYVVQVRQIAARHITNWAMAAQATDGHMPQESAIVNTVGTAEGKIIDLRANNGRLNLEESTEAILLIRHEENSEGVHTQSLLDAIREQKPQGGLKVVVEHSQARIRDHLQYAMVEDPHISFVIQTNDPSFISTLRSDAVVSIKSNGLTASVD